MLAPWLGRATRRPWCVESGSEDSVGCSRYVRGALASQLPFNDSAPFVSQLERKWPRHAIQPNCDPTFMTLVAEAGLRAQKWLSASRLVPPASGGPQNQLNQGGTAEKWGCLLPPPRLSGRIWGCFGQRFRHFYGPSFTCPAVRSIKERRAR